MTGAFCVCVEKQIPEDSQAWCIYKREKTGREIIFLLALGNCCSQTGQTAQRIKLLKVYFSSECKGLYQVTGTFMSPLAARSSKKPRRTKIGERETTS